MSLARGDSRRWYILETFFTSSRRRLPEASAVSSWISVIGAGLTLIGSVDAMPSAQIASQLYRSAREIRLPASLVHRSPRAKRLIQNRIHRLRHRLVD